MAVIAQRLSSYGFFLAAMKMGHFFSLGLLPKHLEINGSQINSAIAIYLGVEYLAFFYSRSLKTKEKYT